MGDDLSELRELARLILSGATDRHLEALRLRREGLAMREVGERLGVSHQRASQLIERARQADAAAVDPRLGATIERWRSDLGDRATNALWREGITTVGAALVASDADLLALRAFGVKSLRRVRRVFGPAISR